MPLASIVANFLNGWIEPGPVTFWEVDPVAYTQTPIAFVKVGGDDDPPW